MSSKNAKPTSQDKGLGWAKGVGTVHKGFETSTAQPPKRPTASKPGHGTGRTA